MSNYAAGHAAEQRAARFLQDQGFKLLQLNWHHKIAEIDIIASKDQRLYFIEVKYRRTKEQGSGFDYITPVKLKRMKRGAELWLSINDWAGEVTLAAIAVSGQGSFELLEIT